MVTKYRVNYTVYGNMAGFKVPLTATAGEFDQPEKAERLAEKLTREKHQPHWVSKIEPEGAARAFAAGA